MRLKFRVGVLSWKPMFEIGILSWSLRLLTFEAEVLILKSVCSYLDVIKANRCCQGLFGLFTTKKGYVPSNKSENESD